MARAGWGVYYGHNSKLNTHAPLRGPIQTSYRAEIRAVLYVIRTAMVPTHVWADCKGVVDTYQDILNNTNFDPEDHADSDLWSIANELLRHAPSNLFKISWMNSHLEEKRNDTKRQQLINDGKLLQLHVDGNVGADAQAKFGADTEGHAVPAPMIEGSHIRADMARTAQNMMYTIWSQRMQEENDPALSTQLHARAAHI